MSDEEDLILLKGYLSKQRRSSRWERRYFWLYRDAVVYASAHDAPTVLGLIPIDAFHYVTKIEGAPGMNGKRFDVIVNSKNFRHPMYLLADSKEECDAWVEQIKKRQNSFSGKKLRFDNTGKFWKDASKLVTALDPNTQASLERRFKISEKMSKKAKPADKERERKAAEAGLDAVSGSLSLISLDEEDSSDEEDGKAGKLGRNLVADPLLAAAAAAEEAASIKRDLMMKARHALKQGRLMKMNTSKSFGRRWQNRWFVLYHDKLEYAKEKGGDSIAIPFSHIAEISIPSVGTGFRFDLVIKSSKHDRGKRLALVTSDNKKLHEWVKAIKEQVYVFWVRQGREGRKKAKELGVTPDIWGNWTFNFEQQSPSSSRESAAVRSSMVPLRRELTAQEKEENEEELKAVAELRALSLSDKPAPEEEGDDLMALASQAIPDDPSPRGGESSSGVSAESSPRVASEP